MLDMKAVARECGPPSTPHSHVSVLRQSKSLSLESVGLEGVPPNDPTAASVRCQSRDSSIGGVASRQTPNAFWARWMHFHRLHPPESKTRNGVSHNRLLPVHRFCWKVGKDFARAVTPCPNVYPPDCSSPVPSPSPARKLHNRAPRQTTMSYISRGPKWCLAS